MIKLIQKLDKRETHPSYMDFVLQKSVEDLRRENKKRLDFEAIEKYFGYLIRAEDSLKAVYTLMHIAKLKDTAVYLLFVLKKSGEGVIDFDTLDENARADCDYIKSELIKNFTLSGDGIYEPELKIPEVSGTGLSDLVKESNFKIESEENESITEQFSGMEMFGDEAADEEISDEEFELIVSEDSEDDALELIDPEEKIPIDDGSDDENDVSGSDAAPVDAVSMTENETIEKADVVLVESVESNFEEIYDSEDGMIEEKVDLDEEEKEELLEEKNIIEIEDESKEESEEQMEVPDEEPYSIGKDPSDLKDASDSKDPSDSKDASDSEVENDEYKDYESTLLEVNELLGDYFLDIDSVTEGKSSPDGEPVLFGKIAELCYIVQERSDKMSFSVISSIYSNIGGIFRKYVTSGTRPSTGEIEMFRSGIRVVEGLIMGYEMEEADDIISSLYNLRKSLEDVKKETSGLNEDTKADEKIEQKIKEDLVSTENDAAASKIDNPGDQSSHKLKDKYSNTELRESFKEMKSQILDLERTFNALDEIEGDYQNYEGLRKLSTTFNNLKEIIRQANILELTDVAKLSEASYVFIKFIQNYRMNPFDEDVREIFKYIIYNFKAASLDKPNEDMERFISYLNDPVKIFTQKNKK